jgi:hypothetical protein
MKRLEQKNVFPRGRGIPETNITGPQWPHKLGRVFHDHMPVYSLNSSTMFLVLMFHRDNMLGVTIDVHDAPS